MRVRRLLIANRGEIALRIIRTAHRMGIATVAVYAAPDAGAAHALAADEAVALGGAGYLDAAALIAAAQARGCDALHPGYGFLSEDADFAEAVAAAGIAFVGPPASAIRAMGRKDAAKALMEAAGVPVVPGYHGADQRPAYLAQEAARIGYPVLIKAVAGGGGRGMRRVDGPQAFAAALAAARAEAEAAFGAGDVLIERYLTRPRHVEVQVFGDGHEVVHLFERDCSLQRRHQKVLEEAPAPGLTPALRDALTDAALRAARAIDYASAGTVEFILDGAAAHENAFYFMEMNTRLQVEHPVTEAITGLDLVEWQLRVAGGEGLPLSQDRITATGHAIELRLYAEDPARDFAPVAGRLTHLAFAQDVRVETGLRPGDAITPHYDALIAKLVVHAPDRDAALAAAMRALGDTQIAGVTSNHAFLRRLLAHPDTRSGAVETGLIAREIATLGAAPVPCSRSRALALITAFDPPQDPLAGLTLWSPLEQAVALDWQDERIEGRISPAGPGAWQVSLGQTRHLLRRLGPRWEVDGHLVPAQTVHHSAGISVFFGNGYHFGVPDPLARDAGSGQAADGVTAPMPGRISALLVQAGDAVAAGQVLARLEAMKMEHALAAPRAGRIAECLITPGDQVAAGALLIRLED